MQWAFSATGVFEGLAKKVAGAGLGGAGRVGRISVSFRLAVALAFRKQPASFSDEGVLAPLMTRLP